MNEVLVKIGESPVSSANANSLAALTANNVKRAYQALCSDAVWPWLERVITLSEWNNEIAVLPGEVQDVKYVTYGGRQLTYVNDRNYSAHELSANFSGVPNYYTMFGRNLVFRPYPTETERANVLVYCVYTPIIDNNDSDYEIDIPVSAEYLLILRTCISMCIDHRQDSGAAQAYTAEYQRLLSQVAHRLVTNHKSSSLLP